MGSSGALLPCSMSTCVGGFPCSKGALPLLVLSVSVSAMHTPTVYHCCIPDQQYSTAISVCYAHANSVSLLSVSAMHTPTVYHCYQCPLCKRQQCITFVHTPTVYHCYQCPLCTHQQCITAISVCYAHANSVSLLSVSAMHTPIVYHCYQCLICTRQQCITAISVCYAHANSVSLLSVSVSAIHTPTSYLVSPRAQTHLIAQLCQIGTISANNHRAHSCKSDSGLFFSCPDPQTRDSMHHPTHAHAHAHTHTHTHTHTYTHTHTHTHTHTRRTHQ